MNVLYAFRFGEFSYMLFARLFRIKLDLCLRFMFFSINRKPVYASQRKNPVEEKRAIS